MPLTESTLDELWSGRPFVETVEPERPPPVPPTSARSVDVAEPTDEVLPSASEEESAEASSDSATASPSAALLQSIVEELQLIRKEQQYTFRAAVALGCLVFAVIVGYMDRLLRRLRLMATPPSGGPTP